MTANRLWMMVVLTAALALLLAAFVGWGVSPTALERVWYGAASVAALLAALGLVFAARRGLLVARPMHRLALAAPAGLVAVLPDRQHILITGATGFIGRRLVEALTDAGHDVTVLTRAPSRASMLRPPYRIVTDLAQIDSDTRVDAVINLAGEPIADGLWTRRKRRAILSSRLRATRAVVRLIGRLKQRPAVLISGSAIGWYGLWGDESLTEFDGGKRCFTHRVCDAWEQEARKAQRLGVRVVRLRIGLVLGLEGGLLGRLLIPYAFGLGGPIGSGRQWMSWIERDDLVRLIAHSIVTPSLIGAVNATAPTPITNAEFSRALAEALRRPALLRMPAAILHHLAGAFADELLLGGQRVLPDKAQVSGFVFAHDTVRSALSAMLSDAPLRADETRQRVWPNSSLAGSAPAEQAVDQPAVESAARMLRSLRLRAR